jgi:HAD superfamily hydrolase (TIGR01509 family)
MIGRTRGFGEQAAEGIGEMWPARSGVDEVGGGEQHLGDGDIEIGKQAAVGLHQARLADRGTGLAGRGVGRVFRKAEGGNPGTDRAGGNKQAAVAGIDQAGDRGNQVHQRGAVEGAVGGFGEHAGAGLDDGEIGSHGARRQKEIMADLQHEGPMPGALAWLEDLQAKKVPRAVVSSSSHPWVDGWLEKLAMDGYFSTVVCRGDAPRIKPAPDLFLEAARHLGARPADCLVVEDSLNGLKAAKAAGMCVWAVPNRVTNCLDFSQADRVFKSLAACRDNYA